LFVGMNELKPFYRRERKGRKVNRENGKTKTSPRRHGDAEKTKTSAV